MADQDDNQARPAAEQDFNHALRAKEEAMHRLIDFMKSIEEQPPLREIGTVLKQEIDPDDPLFLAQYERLSELHAKFQKAKEAAQQAERAYLAALQDASSSATRD